VYTIAIFTFQIRKRKVENSLSDFTVVYIVSPSQ